MRTRNVQIGTHRVVMDVELDGPISGVRKVWKGMRMECKVKGNKVRDL